MSEPNDTRNNDNPAFDCPDVAGVRLYRNGSIEVVRMPTTLTPAILPRAKSAIRKLSFKSRSYLAFVCNETPVEFGGLLTLTYPDLFPRDGKKVKAQLNAILSSMRAHYTDFSYLWFLEFQKRGAPHIHVATTVIPAPVDFDWLMPKWAKSVTEGLHEVEYLKTLAQHSRRKTWGPLQTKDGVARYATKYALKTYQKKVPLDYQNVGRFWGCSRDVIQSIPKPEYIRMTTSGLDRITLYKGHSTANWSIKPRYLLGLVD